MNILRKLKENNIQRNKIEQLTKELGRPDLVFNNKKLKLYTYSTTNICYLIDRTESRLIPKVTVFEDIDEGLHNALTFVHYKCIKLGLDYRCNSSTEVDGM
ncbi:TPA: hypothetical protein KRE82_003614 [Clostridioides difficile]|nr:hypothetical protein [Clostridioides difficile]